MAGKTNLPQISGFIRLLDHDFPVVVGGRQLTHVNDPIRLEVRNDRLNVVVSMFHQRFIEHLIKFVASNRISFVFEKVVDRVIPHGIRRQKAQIVGHVEFEDLD